jgi:hypothetical protein
MNRLLCLLLLGFAACGQAPKSPAPVQPGTTARMVADRQAYYPRLLQLAHGPEKGSLLLSFDTDGTGGALYRSTDGGLTWQLRGTMADTTKPGHCCSGLWEVPQNLGATEAGTLFWTTSVGRGRDPRTATAMNLFRSTDGGYSWRLLSTPVRGSVGLWEAEFSVDATGQLVMYYSTEEHRAEGFNQLLAHKVSPDGGKTWGLEVRDVALPDLPDRNMRPGMAIVRRLPTGRYVMTYEICGLGCDTYIRFSDNGTDWGDPADRGTLVESTARSDGSRHHFSHAPTVTLLPDGRLAVIGQMLFNRDGSLANENGRVYFVGDGTGPWTEHPAPVPVPDAFDNPCPNYSSQLLPLPNGTLLEVALRPAAGGCRPFVATGPLPK